MHLRPKRKYNQVLKARRIHSDDVFTLLSVQYTFCLEVNKCKMYTHIKEIHTSTVLSFMNEYKHTMGYQKIYTVSRMKVDLKLVNSVHFSSSIDDSYEKQTI